MGGRKIGLVDVDSHNFPAKVFSSEYTKDDLTAYNADLIVEGGQGTILKQRLMRRWSIAFPIIPFMTGV